MHPAFIGSRPEKPLGDGKTVRPTALQSEQAFERHSSSSSSKSVIESSGVYMSHPMVLNVQHRLQMWSRF
ncbi:uncharacterized protein CIMG_10516 [Coccidioides immitis RS]|uniref:Uncharacterized protein n=3 Tax=Coccidioides immitis TaxID=5501 RepID=A0A0D8JSS7_COCIM|nr:uncharacterized protein CIMG_10516 [Coccidioides immitis RS]KJF60342.1 hypothetical protein CIMG_10516 [Coccidioides immitis RS]KMP00119.1 hypothetical protein CIRG_00260 [Coccidioides immitis RMSCC 2394]KMU84299.1 hypothetical protein CIHG_02084 [Coccidioides immitis H538.4]